MKTAIITGASCGIGAAIAQRFIADGFRVINVSRRPNSDSQVENLACDLLNEAQVQSAIGKCLDILSSSESTCLVHNATILNKDRADDCDSALLEEVLRVSVIAVNRLNQELLPHMQPGSSVIYIGSTLSEKAVPGAFSYVVSKHAQLGMMRATCQDLSGRDVHTACICPGFTDTKMLREHLQHDEETLRAVAAMNSFGRLVEPGEIADLVSWVHNNPVINGSVLHANLGQLQS